MLNIAFLLFEMLLYDVLSIIVNKFQIFFWRMKIENRPPILRIFAGRYPELHLLYIVIHTKHHTLVHFTPLCTWCALALNYMCTSLVH